MRPALGVSEVLLYDHPATARRPSSSCRRSAPSVGAHDPAITRALHIGETNMSEHEWIKEFPASITVCDPAGVIAGDERPGRQNLREGRRLRAASAATCWTATRTRPAARSEVLLAAHEKNVYTIEKNGVKKLIYQSPWFKDGQYAGFVELSLEIPWEMPHFVRS